MKRLAPLIVLLLYAAPAWAGTQTCNAGLISAGYCASGEVLFSWDAPSGQIDEIEAVSDDEDLAADYQVLSFFARARRVECVQNDVDLSVCRFVGYSAMTIALPTTEINKLSNYFAPDEYDTIRCRDEDVVTIPGVTGLIPPDVTVPFWAQPATNNPVTSAPNCDPLTTDFVDNPRSNRFRAWREIRARILLAALQSKYDAAVAAAAAAVDSDYDVE